MVRFLMLRFICLSFQSFHVVSNSNSTEEPLEMMMTTERENSTDYQDQSKSQNHCKAKRKKIV